MIERLHDEAFARKAAASVMFGWFERDADGAFFSALSVKSAASVRFAAFEKGDADAARESALVGSRRGTDFRGVRKEKARWSSCRRGVGLADAAFPLAEANQTPEPTRMLLSPPSTSRQRASSPGRVAHL